MTTRTDGGYPAAAVPTKPPRPPRKITIIQAITLATIRNYRHLHGYTPSIRDLASEMHKSRGSVYQSIQSLQRLGLLSRPAGRHRAIEIVPPKQDRTDAFSADDAFAI